MDALVCFHYSKGKIFRFGMVTSGGTPNSEVTKAKFIDQICVSLGGCASKEIISSDALDDLEKVTKQDYVKD